jgi:hypothetical protein
VSRRSEEPQSDVSDLDQLVGPWPRPIMERHWIDEQGIRWHIRGRGIPADGPALRRLLKRPGLRVLHAYGPHPREVTGQERHSLLERVNRSAAGEAPPHSAFRLAEFRNEDRQVMLVIEEAC